MKKQRVEKILFSTDSIVDTDYQKLFEEIINSGVRHWQEGSEKEKKITIHAHPDYAGYVILDFHHLFDFLANLVEKKKMRKLDYRNAIDQSATQWSSFRQGRYRNIQPRPVASGLCAAAAFLHIPLIQLLCDFLDDCEKKQIRLFFYTEYTEIIHQFRMDAPALLSQLGVKTRPSTSETLSGKNKQEPPEEALSDDTHTDTLREIQGMLADLVDQQEKHTQDRHNTKRQSPAIILPPKLQSDSPDHIDRYHYIDLFDDALYDVFQFDHDLGVFKDHFNAIRYQLFLAILFNKTIVVPEQWAVSSAMFMQIVGEMLDGLEGRETTMVPAKQPSLDYCTANPPLLISYQNRGVDRSLAYLHAFIERLDSHRRIQLSSLLVVPENDRPVPQRTQLSGYFKEIVNANRGVVQNWLTFQLELEAIFESPRMARNVRNLFRYLSTFPANQVCYDENKYRTRLAHNVIDVKNAVNADALSQLGPEMEAFREFFKRVLRDNIPFDQIMVMQDTLSGYSDESRALIQKIGRFVMHGALAENIGANFTTSFSNAFDPINQLTLSGEYDHAIVNEIRQSRRHRFTANPFIQPDFSVWTIKSSRDPALYDGVHNINWESGVGVRVGFCGE